MGQWHNSNDADWTVTDRAPAGCKAEGVMPRLPVRLLWDLRIEEGRLVWSVALYCERETAIDAADLNMYLPLSCARWHYDELEGLFPDIQPGDLTWTSVVSPEVSCTEAALLPRVTGGQPPLLVRVCDHQPWLQLRLSNSDYVQGSRVCQLGGRLPEAVIPLPPGLLPLAVVEIDPTLDLDGAMDRLKARRRARALTAGPIQAHLERGHVVLSTADATLTSLVHVYTSMLIGDLWNDSLGLLWGPLERVGEGMLRATGESRRFPFRQAWELDVDGDALAWRVWLEALEPLDVQEYHASIGLRGEYGRWQTDHEDGAFPPFEPGREAWLHANRCYRPGRHITALSPAFPSVTLEAATEEIPFRMTAINAGYSQNTRVLQALRTPDAGVMRFEPGRHLYFAGHIRAKGADTR